MTKKAGTPRKPYLAIGVSQGSATCGTPCEAGPQKPKWYKRTPSTATRRSRSSASTRDVELVDGGMIRTFRQELAMTGCYPGAVKVLLTESPKLPVLTL